MLGQTTQTQSVHTLLSTTPDTGTPGGLSLSAGVNGTFLNGSLGSLNANNACYDSVSNHSVEQQGANTAVTLINATASSQYCAVNNDWVTSNSTWSSVSSTGMIVGASQFGTSTSLKGEVVTLAVGTAAATTTAGFKDLNAEKLSLFAYGHVAPQASIVVDIRGGSFSMDQGDEGILSTYAIAENSFRSGSSSSIAVRAYADAISGQAQFSDDALFNYTGRGAHFYFDGGCYASPACIVQAAGTKNDEDNMCSAGSTATQCVNTGLVITITGTSGVISSGNGAVAMGSIISGGTVTAGTVVTGIQSSHTGSLNGAITVSPSQNTSCSPCTITSTTAQVAGQLAGTYKKFIYSFKNVANSYRVVAAKLPVGTTGVTGMVQGDRVKLVPPSGSGIVCSMNTTNSAFTSYPVATQGRVTNGQPENMIVSGALHDPGVCSGSAFASTALGGLGTPFTSADGRQMFTMPGWTPTGGSGNWNGATVTVTYVHNTVPLFIAGVIPLQNSTFGSVSELPVLEPTRLGGAGFNDDVVANATFPQPNGGCPTPGSCATLGTGYGADAANLMIQDTYAGGGNYTSSSLNPALPLPLSYDGDHCNAYCQGVLSGNLRAAIDPLMGIYP
jgi:hypothetical protein